MSVPNRANDPKRKAGLYTPGQIARGEHKAPTPFVPKSAPVTPPSKRRDMHNLKPMTTPHDMPNRDIYKKQPPKL